MYKYPRRVICLQKIAEWSKLQGNYKYEHLWSSSDWVNRNARTFRFSILPWHLEQTFAAAAKALKIHVWYMSETSMFYKKNGCTSSWRQQILSEKSTIICNFSLPSILCKEHYPWYHQEKPTKRKLPIETLMEEVLPIYFEKLGKKVLSSQNILILSFLDCKDYATRYSNPFWRIFFFDPLKKHRDKLSEFFTKKWHYLSFLKISAVIFGKQSNFFQNNKKSVFFC